MAARIMVRLLNSKASQKILVIVFFILCFCIKGSAQEDHKTIVLMMNHQFPADAPGSKLDQWVADQIFEKTDRRVSIRIFWENTLGDPRDNLSLLKRGVIDMAAMSAGYFPDEMPLLAAPNSIPMAMETICQSSILMDRILKTIPAVTREAIDHGIYPLFFHVLNPYLLVSKSPVTGLADLQGKRIRTWGNEMASLIRAAGGIPVPLFLPDVHDAMAEDIIDGCPFSLDLMVAYDLYKIAGHITEVVLWEGPSWGIWVRQGAWEKLTTEDRQIFIETAQEARQREILLTLKAEAEARLFLKDQGVVFHQFPEKDLESWKSKSPDFFHDFITHMEAIGKGSAARQMVTVWENLQQEVKCP